MFDERVERALQVARDAHGGQLRKGGTTPYAVHPLHVALLLVRLGARTEVVQAGLLHDVVEDCDGWTLERVEAEFGLEVHAMVAEVTEDKDLSWTERKEAAVRSVQTLSEGALLIKACDKLHNLSCLAASLDEAADREEVWARFRGGRERTLEIADRLVAELEVRLESPLAGALRAALERLRTA